MHSVPRYWKPERLLAFDGFCPPEGCCRSWSYSLEVLRLGVWGRTYAEIELHAQSCDELQTEWNGNVLGCVSSGAVEAVWEMPTRW